VERRKSKFTEKVLKNEIVGLKYSLPVDDGLRWSIPDELYNSPYAPISPLKETIFSSNDEES
jgi:hypothetical protein